MYKDSFLASWASPTMTCQNANPLTLVLYWNIGTVQTDWTNDTWINYFLRKDVAFYEHERRQVNWTQGRVFQNISAETCSQMSHWEKIVGILHRWRLIAMSTENSLLHKCLKKCVEVRWQCDSVAQVNIHSRQLGALWLLLICMSM